MAEVIDSFPDKDALQKWRNPHRIMKHGKCVGYAGYLVNPQAGQPKKKMLHTAKCQHSAPDVGELYTHWLASEDQAALIARADTLHPSQGSYTWRDCKRCVAEVGSLE